MDYLWSPWRMEYILSPKSGEGCIFCEGLKQADGTDNLIVYRGKVCFRDAQPLPLYQRSPDDCTE